MNHTAATTDNNNERRGRYRTITFGVTAAAALIGMSAPAAADSPLPPFDFDVPVIDVLDLPPLPAPPETPDPTAPDEPLIPLPEIDDLVPVFIPDLTPAFPVYDPDTEETEEPADTPEVADLAPDVSVFEPRPELPDVGPLPESAEPSTPETPTVPLPDIVEYPDISIDLGPIFPGDLWAAPECTPSVTDDRYEVAANTPTEFAAGTLLSNDAETCELPVRLQTFGTRGIVVSFDGPGGFRYTPEAGFSGVDTFQYDIMTDDTDGATVLATGNVTIEVVDQTPEPTTPEPTTPEPTTPEPTTPEPTTPEPTTPEPTTPEPTTPGTDGGSPSSKLPSTGGDLVRPLGIGAGLLVLTGGTLLVATRRRQEQLPS